MDIVHDMPLANKKVLDVLMKVMKDKNNEMLMTQFVGLKAKMHAMRMDGTKDTKNAKGVKNNLVA